MKSNASLIREANEALVVQALHDSIGRFFAADYSVHLTHEVMTGGHRLVRGFLELYQRAFPDLKAEVEILVEGQDRVAWQRTLRGTHQGAFKGFPASGLTLVWRDVVVSEFRAALIAKEWVISDLAEQLLLSRKKK